MSIPIFIGGTSSHAGKSWMTTAICAWLRRQGVRVAPFKAQNMSNNSYPCRAGGEIGRAQATQAWACGLEPEPAMNPILLKPNSDGGSQVVVNGQVWKNLSPRDYTTFSTDIGELALVPGTGGVFEIRIGDDTVWSRAEKGRFPGIKELKQVEIVLPQDKDLGHSDRYLLEIV